MTRRSRREIERSVDDLAGDGGAPEDWVRAYVETGAVDMEPLVEFVDDDGKVTTRVGERDPDVAGICIGTARPWRYYAPREDVPAWVDVDGDLPVGL